MEKIFFFFFTVSFDNFTFMGSIFIYIINITHMVHIHSVMYCVITAGLFQQFSCFAGLRLCLLCVWCVVFLLFFVIFFPLLLTSNVAKPSHFTDIHDFFISFSYLFFDFRVTWYDNNVFICYWEKKYLNFLILKF